jgi:hypothetical protein
MAVQAGNPNRSRVRPCSRLVFILFVDGDRIANVESVLPPMRSAMRCRLTNPRRDHDGGDGGDGGDANLRPNHRSILRPDHRSGALCCGVPREGRNGTPTPGPNDIRHAVQHGQEGRSRSPHRRELAQRQRSR